MSYTARLFIPTDEEYQSITELYNLDWPDAPIALEQSVFDDVSRPKQYFHQRLMVQHDGKWVSEGHYGEMHWSPNPGKYYFIYSIHPEHYGPAVQEAFYKTMVDDLQERRGDITELVAWSREDKTERVDFFKSKGFELAMRFPISELLLESFDPTPFATLPAKIADAGFEIFSVAELETLDPDWQQRTWQLDEDIRIDLPSIDPMKPRPFEEFIKRFNDPMILQEAFFIGILTNGSRNPAEWRYAGTSALWKSADPEKLETGLTGVRREFRRYGLATALKLHAISYAKSQGIKRIEADNEENNPMFQINLALGFQPRPAFVDYIKKFGSTGSHVVSVGNELM